MGRSIKPILGPTPINTAQGSRSLHGEQTIQFAFIPKKRDANQVDQIRGRIKYQRSISPKSIAKRDLLITVARLPLCLRVYIYIVAGSVLWFLTSWLFGDNQNRKLKIRMRKHHACLLLIVDY